MLKQFQKLKQIEKFGKKNKNKSLCSYINKSKVKM